MRIFDYSCLGISILAIIIAAIFSAIQYGKSKRTINTLSKMLDSAIDGSFHEDIFDESKSSALETRMAHYLAQCSASSQNLLIEKEKIKELISDISHQTKTPISNILLYAELLSEHPLPEEDSVCINALSEQAEKLNFLISALVKISRMETGIITVTPKNQPVEKLLDLVTRQIAPKAESKHIKLLIEKTDQYACFDLKWTTEAIYNIVDNEVKYSKDNSSISIKTMPYELFYRIDIMDQGIGIAEEEMNKIFTRFYRSQSVSQQEGVGIGLFLAREIISMENGYIKVTSKVGQGTTFSIFLPRE